MSKMSQLHAEMSEQGAFDQSIQFMEEMPQKYALIDYGRVSGKHPFVYFISDDKESLEKSSIEYGYKKDDIIQITESEYIFLSSIPDGIEVSYCAGAKNKFFF